MVLIIAPIAQRIVGGLVETRIGSAT
jgi:hypothetical protein